ncbi:MAG TPA: protein kinase, partial [Gemmataceae bacterium]|nr:protein kinase [Gemmataceae bacterium]
MSAQPVYRSGIARGSDSQGTLLPRKEFEDSNIHGLCPEPSAPDVQTLGGHDTRHDSQHRAERAAAFPERRAEPFAPPDVLSFLKPPLAEGELGWLAHYRVLRVLGAGGMGMVLEAEDTHLQRRVALKVIRPEMAGDASLRQRFLREARAMAAIQSDHLVTIYQVGQDRDTPFLSMQYLHGETLQSRIQRQTRVPLSEL